jgi:hypothetical protein
MRREDAQVPGTSSSGRERLLPWAPIHCMLALVARGEPALEVGLVLREVDVADAQLRKAELRAQARIRSTQCAVAAINSALTWRVLHRRPV